MNLFEFAEMREMVEVNTEQRDYFQREVPAANIKAIEEKFLNVSLRSRDEHPAKLLTDGERETYARYLESKGQPKGAASFRNYVEPEKPKQLKRRRIELPLPKGQGILGR